MRSTAIAKPLEVGSSSLVDRVIRHIDKLIGQGELKLGDSISEPTLIATLGIGRVPVREAIRILAGEGILELVPNRSARVRQVDSVEILEMLDVLTGFSATAIHLLGTRPIEPAFAEQLLASADDINALAKAGHGANDLMREISRFHYILIQASGNNYLIRLLQKTRINYYSRYLVTLLGRRAFIAAAPRYKRMAEAVIRGDSLAAIRILLRSTEYSKSHAKMD